MVVVCKVEDPSDIEAVKTSVSSGSGKEVKDETTHHDSKGEARGQKASFARISPSAKLLISEYGLDASSLKASGAHGTLLKSDVLAAIKSGKGSSRKSSPKEQAAPSPQKGPQPSTTALPESKSQLQQSDSFEDLPNTQIRKVDSFLLLE